MEDHVANTIADEYSPPMLWTVVELNLGVICACLALMRPVWRATVESSFVSKIFSSFSSLAYSSNPSKGSTYQSFDKHDEMELGIVSSGDLSTGTGKAQ